MDPTEELEIETRIGEVLKSIYDPEIPVNIYGMQKNKNSYHIFTSINHRFLPDLMNLRYTIMEALLSLLKQVC